MNLIASIIPGLGPISQFFANVLKFFDSFTGNFAVSVILLTVAFRIVVLPLSMKQTKSMIAMQKIQPQMKEIQKKYKDDREKQGQEMMKLYKENKVNPLGGCLPLLLQLPILFALFDVLRDPSKYIKWATSYSFLGIDNVMATGSVMWSGGKVQTFNYVTNTWYKKPQPYAGGEYLAVIVLILLTVITGYLSSKMMMTDPKQSKAMALMPVLFGVFAWILPAGVTIYIVVTNVLTMAQQYVQLAKQGFYEERKQQREKIGEPTAFIERLKWNTAKVLVATRIKKPPQPVKKKPAGKSAKATDKTSSPETKKSKPTGKKSPAGSTPAEQKAGAGAGKKTEEKKPAAQKKPQAVAKKGSQENKADEKTGQDKAAPQKGESRDYPARKKKGK